MCILSMYVCVYDMYVPPTQNSKPWGVANACSEYCAANDNTSYYMGPIHPRVKKPLTKRLARAANAVAYGAAVASSGPTIKGCELQGRELSIRFDTDALRVRRGGGGG